MRSHKTFVLPALVTMLLTTAAAAQEVFVAPASAGGSDTTSSGSLGAPYATVAYALRPVSSGTTITLRQGTYVGGITIGLNDVTLQSYEGEWATISAPINNSSVGMSVWVNATGARIRNIEIQGGYYYALKFEEGNAQVSDCRLHDSGRDCVKIVPGADNITIERCEVYNSGKRDDSNADSIDNVNADNMIVRDCFIHDTGTNCAYAKGGARNVLFGRNLVMRCGSSGIMLGQSTDTHFLDPSQNPTYKKNIDGVVHNCIIVDTGGAGLAAQAALRPKFYNNTLVNVAASYNGGISFASNAPLGRGGRPRPGKRLRGRWTLRQLFSSWPRRPTRKPTRCSGSLAFICAVAETERPSASAGLPCSLLRNHLPHKSLPPLNSAAVTGRITAADA